MLNINNKHWNKFYTEKKQLRVPSSFAKFINKNSPTLFQELRRLMLHDFGFGDFEFRLPQGKIISKVSSVSFSDLSNIFRPFPELVFDR